LAISLVITGVLLFFTVKNFSINTDLTQMISNDLPFRRVVREYHAQFPNLVGSIAVVIEGDNPENVRQARNLLADRLRRENTIFSSVYAPGKGTFWDKNALLYLSDKELEQQGDTLSEMQPFLALLSQDFSLSGLFSVLGKIVDSPDISLSDNPQIFRLFQQVNQVITKVEQGKTASMSWQELLMGDKKLSRHKQFILLQPVLNYQAINPAKKAITLIRQKSHELHLDKKYGIHISITGKPVINYEDLRSVRRDITLASVVSFVLVGIILYLGLGSIRLVFAGLTTLLAGLAWTIAFAILVVGRLNMISVTFVVLFIGLGIDYGIQICLRYEELLAEGCPHRDAVGLAVQNTGNALLLCAISTAIGFYAFVPTAYVGASELGLISGTGMLFILLASITVLPAIMLLLPRKKAVQLPLSFGTSISQMLAKYPRLIVVTAAVAALLSLALLPKVRFDANPFHMSDQRSESIQTAMRLFDDIHTPPWTISILTDNRAGADRLAQWLKQLPEVRTVLTIDDFIPRHQEDKLSQIEDMALVLPPVPKLGKGMDTRDRQRIKKALADFSAALEKIRKNDRLNHNEVSTITQLAVTVRNFRRLLAEPGRDALLPDRLYQALLPGLVELFSRMQTLMEAEPVTLDELPKDLVSRYVSSQGKYRIQIFPKKDLRDIGNLEKFVAAVTNIAPNGTDQPVTVLMAGKTIVSAFRTASLLAFILIALFLRLVMHTWKEVMLVLAPLLLALCYTMAIAVLFGIPFNFANIIIVPLLLGIGVDSGI
ncbi:MAG TPA: hopanoid biosynthesis-associated RND transporter HpnN, partial [Desulfobulbaceae bacterium]|nr:hopanoid biosynthesis-associated RND transporter HpnN [Desulfobulbaceae bacterium]